MTDAGVNAICQAAIVIALFALLAFICWITYRMIAYASK